jgi:hypothetical protein
MMAQIKRMTLVVGVLLASAAAAPRDAPDRVEVKDKTAFLMYRDGAREQRDVEEGDRFEVLRRLDSYYVVRDGNREALISIASVIPVKTPKPVEKWQYVITTAQAPISMRTGRRGTPSTVEQGKVFEVLGKHPLGSTYYILLDNGRTAEIATNLVRPARPQESPPPPAVGQLTGPVRLGCEITLDKAGNVYVGLIYAGSLAERIGLQPEMRILKVNGEEINSAADYDRASRLLGGNLRLMIQRRGLDYPEMIQYQDPRNRSG